MQYAVIADLVAEKISGEWGDEPASGEGVRVIRNTNFTNHGHINFSKVVLRKIAEKKIEKKKLKIGDVIIEKSGGSPTQPVGRVVYFGEKNGTYLCNNFTSVLRPSAKVYPRYFFYCLFYLHLSKRTLGYQNKTTGIINLKLDRYLQTEKIPLPSLEEQKRIVTTLDQADALRQKRKEAIKLLDEYVQSVFMEMFGDPVTNPKGWSICTVGDVVSGIVAGTSYGGEQKEKLDDDEMGVLKIRAVTWGKFDPTEFKAVKKKLLKKKIISVKNGDLLFSRANTRELVAATSIVDNDYPQLFLPDKLWRIDLKKSVCDKYFFDFLLRSQGIRDSLTKTATGTSGSMLNISMQKFRALLVPIPPIDMQHDFAKKVEDVAKVEMDMNMQLHESDHQFNALMQKAFAGTL